MVQMVGAGTDDRGEVRSFDPGVDDAGLLAAVVAHYRAALADAPAVTGWLVEHGITSRRAGRGVRAGLVRSHLGAVVAERRAGRRAGAPRSAAEPWGCCGTPGMSSSAAVWSSRSTTSTGRIVQCYGQRVQRPQRRDGEQPEQVLWLASDLDAGTGIWHRQAMASAEVIVADSVLDGLVWWSAGYRNVLAPGGPDGLPADLPDQLIEAGVTRVLLAQARTPAGETAAASFRSPRLGGAGFGVLPGGVPARLRRRFRRGRR